MREDCAFWSGTDQALSAINGNMLTFIDPDTEDEQKVSSRFVILSATFCSFNVEQTTGFLLSSLIFVTRFVRDFYFRKKLIFTVESPNQKSAHLNLFAYLSYAFLVSVSHY